MTPKHFCGLLCFLFVAKILTSQPLFFEISKVLREHGFENIHVADSDSGDLEVYYENRIYRDELYAAGIVMALIDSLAMGEENIILIPGRRAFPICELQIRHAAYDSFMAEIVDAKVRPPFVTVADFREKLAFRRHDLKSPSFGKIDLTVYPTFSVYLGNYDDRFKLFFALMPVVSTTLWKGAAAYAEASIPLYNDVNYQYFRFIDYPQLSKAAVSQIVRLPFNVVASLSYGVYNPNRYGWAGEVNKSFFHRRLAMGYSFEYTGFLLYYDKVWYKSKKDLLTSKAYAIYYSNFLNCQFGVSYNHYVMKDAGWLFEFSRNFRETTVGAFAGSTPIDKFGGLALRFPLSRLKRPKPGRVRAVLPSYYEYSYRATNKVYTQHSPVQTGISVYTGTKLSYLDMHLTPNYVVNNLDLFRSAFKNIYEKKEGGDEEENLRGWLQQNKR